MGDFKKMNQVKIKIVSGSGGLPQRVAYNQIKLDFKSHCILCLEPQPQGPGTFLHDVTGKNPKNIEDFQTLIHYLTGTDPTLDKSVDECLRMGVPFMGKLLPPMCPPCYDIMAEMYRLHKQLLLVQGMIQKQTNLAREVVRGTLHGRATSSGGIAPASSSRQLFYSRILNSSSEDGEVTVVQQQVTSEAFTIKFVEGLHDRVIVEANAQNKIKFPSYLPPNFKLVGKGSQGKRKARGEAGPPGPTQTATPSASSALRRRPDGTLEIIRKAPPTRPPGSAGSGTKPEIIDLDSEGEDVTTAGGGDLWEPELEVPDVASPTVIDLDSDDESCSSSKKVRNNAGASQPCDLCGKRFLCSKILEHLSTHHIKDYIHPCPNPSCPRAYSCRGKLAVHFYSERKTCKVVATRMGLHPLIPCEGCGVNIHCSQFRIHLQDHERQIKEKSHPCPIPGCQSRYALKQSVGEHLVTHDLREKTDQTCPSCNETIKIADMPEHLNQAHEVKKTDIVPCKRCPFLFPNWGSLLDHLVQHSSGVGLSCDMCDAPEVTFSKYSSLRQHYFNLHQIGTKFCCEHCDFEYFSQRSLTTHVKTAHSTPNNDGSKVAKVPSKKTVKCQLCPEVSFHSRVGLLDHQLKVHDAPPVTCKFCPEAFTTVASLKRHERGHQGLGRTYKCNVASCGRVFRSFTIWQQHQRWAHTSDPNFVCDTCGKRFYMKHFLRDHIKQVHLKIRGPRRVCEECGESLSSGTALRIHKLIHTGARPHKCPICDQAFRHKEVLKTHVEGHEKKGDSFKPNGPMKNVRKRVAPKEPQGT